MGFVWENLRGAWEAVLPLLNRRLKDLQYLLQDVRRVEGYLLYSSALQLQRPATLVMQDTIPATPDAERAVLYLRDDGTGKMELVIRYPSGAIGILDTEP